MMSLNFEDLRAGIELITILNNVTLRARDDGIVPFSEVGVVKGPCIVYDDKHPDPNFDPDIDLKEQVVEYPVLNPPSPELFHPCLKSLIDRIELRVQITYGGKPELYASIYGFEKDPYRILEPQSVIHISFDNEQYLWGSPG